MYKPAKAGNILADAELHPCRNKHALIDEQKMVLASIFDWCPVALYCLAYLITVDLNSPFFNTIFTLADSYCRGLCG